MMFVAAASAARGRGLGEEGRVAARDVARAGDVAHDQHVCHCEWVLVSASIEKVRMGGGTLCGLVMIALK